MLYLALSCLQGRPMDEVSRDLLSLYPDGIQLTPGTIAPHIQLDLPTRTHHGYTNKGYRVNVWHVGSLTGKWDSVHPPLKKHVKEGWVAPRDIIIETMYPGYADMSCGVEIERAMDENRDIAVDVAHLDMQTRAGLLTDRQKNRIIEYENVREIHVSTSKGVKDSHFPVEKNHWGTRWALERINEIPVVIESYLHKLSQEEREEQVGIFR